MPPIDKLLENIMSEWPLPAFEQKICPPEELAARLAALPRPLVFTNGCFDILHRGHVTYLAQAKATGAFLILALNTDASVRRLGKGDNRPVNPLENRAAVAAALESVDYVTWFDDDTPAALIEQLCPDANYALINDFNPAMPKGQDLDDPWYGPASGFRSTLADIEAAMPGILDALA